MFLCMTGRIGGSCPQFSLWLVEVLLSREKWVNQPTKDSMCKQANHRESGSGMVPLQPNCFKTFSVYQCSVSRIPRIPNPLWIPVPFPLWQRQAKLRRINKRDTLKRRRRKSILVCINHSAGTRENYGYTEGEIHVCFCIANVLKAHWFSQASG